MTTKELTARLTALAKRLNDDMEDPDVAHRLRLLVPGIEQLEATVSGLETKVRSVAEHRSKVRKRRQPRKPRQPPVAPQRRRSTEDLTDE